MEVSRSTSQKEKPKGMTSLVQYGSLVGILVALVGIGLGANWVYHLYYPEAPALLVFADPNEYVNALNASVSAQTIPQGLAQEFAGSRVYFMLANKGSAYAQPHVYESGAFSLMPENGLEDWYYSYSPDGSNMTFFATTPERAELFEGWEAEAQLYVITQASLNGKSLPGSLEGIASLDSTRILNKQLPSVSDSGEVLFMGREAADGTWTIYHATAEGTQVFGDGSIPKWINDTEFVFLGEDGLYLGNAQTRQKRLLLESLEPEEVFAYPDSRIDVSNDGTMLAWSHLDHDEIHLYEIVSSSEKTSLLGRGAISGYASWLAFSPSGRYLAATMADSENPSADPKPRIVFFDLTAPSAPIKDYAISLDAFERSYVFITDWASRTP